VVQAEKLGQWRMPVGTAIRAMCRAPKSREGDHFQAAVGLRSQLESYTPDVPDWTCDQHTNRGKALGRGLDYFRAESTKLVPAPAEKDPYEDEAYRLWELKRKGVQPTAATRGKGTVRTTANCSDRKRGLAPIRTIGACPRFASISPITPMTPIPQPN